MTEVEKITCIMASILYGSVSNLDAAVAKAKLLMIKVMKEETGLELPK